MPPPPPPVPPPRGSLKAWRRMVKPGLQESVAQVAAEVVAAGYHWGGFLPDGRLDLGLPEPPPPDPPPEGETPAEPPPPVKPTHLQRAAMTSFAKRIVAAKKWEDSIAPLPEGVTDVGESMAE